MSVCSTLHSYSYNALLESILRSDKLCSYYTGLPTVELLKYLFEWIEPAAKTQSYGMVVENTFRAEKVVGREINILRSTFFIHLVNIRQGYGS